MIAVVADDLTGAAELGGIGLRYNLRVEINTKVNLLSKADLQIIATDTRSQKRPEAQAEMAKVTHELAQLSPLFIFKKVDSVLRGHVLPEISAQLSALHLHRALVVPANPTLGRTLVNGVYFVQGQPIHLSSFSQDPEFAITSSRVLDIVGASYTGIPVYVQKAQTPLPNTGIVIGEVTDTADLLAWAERTDKNMLIAGASGFFTALIDTLGIKSTVAPTANIPKALGMPALYVCGSTFHKSRQLVKYEKDNGGPVSYMPKKIADALLPSEEQYAKWSKEIVDLIHTYGSAIIAIDPAKTEGKQISAGVLRERTACVVEKVFLQTSIHELLIEGGSTASAILSRLKLSRFKPIEEASPGVIRMSVEGKQNLCLTLKPGSYEWPASIWKFNSIPESIAK